jgi:MFS family permease
MGLSMNYGMLMVSAFWAGFANMLVFVNVGTVMMEQTPSDKVGRVITTRQVAVASVRLTALLGFGWLADAYGIRGTILLMAGVSAIGTAWAAVHFPELWRYAGLNAQSEEQPASRPRRPRSAIAIVQSGTRFIQEHVDPTFVLAEQSWLNASTIFVTGLGAVAFFVMMPIRAIGILLAVSAALVGASLVRLVAQRLRAVARLRNKEGGRS